MSNVHIKKTHDVIGSVLMALGLIHWLNRNVGRAIEGAGFCVSNVSLGRGEFLTAGALQGMGYRDFSHETLLQVGDPVPVTTLSLSILCRWQSFPSPTASSHVLQCDISARTQMTEEAKVKLRLPHSILALARRRISTADDCKWSSREVSLYYQVLCCASMTVSHRHSHFASHRLHQRGE